MPAAMIGPRTLLAAAVAMLVLGAPCLAADDPLTLPKLEIEGPLDSTVRLEVFDRLRGEFVDWFAPAPTAPAPTYRYNFLGNKLQLGLRVKRDPWELFLQFQDSTLANVPPDAVGIGGTYFANTMRETQNGAILRNAWLSTSRLFGVTGLFVRGGRQLYLDGAEGRARNPSLRWLQDNRIAQRLVGPFDYTHVGRSFDGAAAGYDTPRANLTAFFFKPTYGGFEVDANPELNINLAGAALTLKDADEAPSPLLENTLARLFWIFYDDNRNLVFVDNRPLAARQADRGSAASLNTVGASAARVDALGPGLADALLYGFGQTGSWQSLQQRSWAYGVELGYRLPEVWAAPWMRLGIDSGSGDQDPGDGLHETFFQMLPTAWLYAQFPFYNMMNSQDVFAQWILDPDPRVSFRLDFHWLRLNSGNDLQYSGGGATSNTFFGFAGLPSGGHTELAYLVHFLLTWRATGFLTFNALYAHAFGQGVIASNFEGDDANYGYLESALSF
jgi:hypothetical protein